jgi:hypothetical protein
MRLPEFLRQPVNHSSEDMILQFITGLRGIWAKLEGAHGAPITSIKSSARKITIHGVNLWDYVPQCLVSSRSETAITIAFYCMAWIIIIVETRKRTRDNQVYDQLILAHCSIILKAGIYIEDFEDGCGYIRMIFPLRLVVLYSPDVQQRESARYRLELWRTNRGLGGICSVALVAESEIPDSFSKY